MKYLKYLLWAVALVITWIPAKPVQAQNYPPGFYVYDITSDDAAVPNYVLNYGWSNSPYTLGTITNYDCTSFADYSGFVYDIHGNHDNTGKVSSAGQFTSNVWAGAPLVWALGTYEVAADNSSKITIIDMLSGDLLYKSEKQSPVWGWSYIW